MGRSMNQSGGQGGDGSGNQPPEGGPYTTQPGMGRLKSPDPNQNPTQPDAAPPAMNPVPGQPVLPQTLAGGHGQHPNENGDSTRD